MKFVCSLSDLLLEIEKLLDEITQNLKLKIIFLGGCSRSGKSYVAHRIQDNIKKYDITSLVIDLDSWLFSMNQRKNSATVLERYDIKNIQKSIIKLYNGKSIYPPLYNPTSRMRICDRRSNPLQINHGLIIIEGVVALAIPELLGLSSLNIFVDIPDSLRKSRLSKFYLEEKKVSEKEYNLLLEAREKEEVPFIKSTKINAEIIFDNRIKVKNKEIYGVF